MPALGLVGCIRCEKLREKEEGILFFSMMGGMVYLVACWYEEVIAHWDRAVHSKFKKNLDYLALISQLSSDFIFD